jgi:Peptidase M50B-like
VGRPVAFGIGFAVLGFVAFTGGVARSIVTVAHEGGHMLAALLSGRGIMRFELIDGDESSGGGRTRITRIQGLGVSDIFIAFIGYATPPLAGLGGAYAVADGNAWGVLVIGVVLLIAVLFVPKINPLALAVTGLLLVGIVWALIAGGPGIKGALAVALVWLLLIGGLRIVVVRNTGSGDAEALSRYTWIPRVVWFAIWLAIALISLWIGGRVLLGYT